MTWRTYRALYSRSACQALAEPMGLDFADVRDPTIAQSTPQASEWSALYALMEADLGDVRRPPSDPDRDAVLQRDLQVNAVLGRVDALGATFQTAERAELEALLETTVSSSEDGLRQLDARLSLESSGIGRHRRTAVPQCTCRSTVRAHGAGYGPDGERAFFAD
jgi:hypothetical protein